ncbi:ribonuclease H-like domain-containing protein [Tanacetum coccineum]
MVEYASVLSKRSHKTNKECCPDKSSKGFGIESSKRRNVTFHLGLRLIQILRTKISKEKRPTKQYLHLQANPEEDLKDYAIIETVDALWEESQEKEQIKTSRLRSFEKLAMGGAQVKGYHVGKLLLTAKVLESINRVHKKVQDCPHVNFLDNQILKEKLSYAKPEERTACKRSSIVPLAEQALHDDLIGTKKVTHALAYESWVEAMQEELLQLNCEEEKCMSNTSRFENPSHPIRSTELSGTFMPASSPNIMKDRRDDHVGQDSPFHLEAFSDSDYAGDNHDRRSTSGGCQYLVKRLVLWMQNQLLDYGFNFMNTEIHIDNESTICIVKNPVFHSKTKHIQIRHHFIRDCYEQRLINVVKIHTDDNVADLLTKGFDLARFNFLVEVDIIKKTENQAKMTKLSMEWKRLCKIKAKNYLKEQTICKLKVKIYSVNRSNKEQVSEDTTSFVKSSLNVDKETIFLDKKIECVKPKNHEKPVKKPVRYAEIYRSQSPRGNQRKWNGQKFNQLGSDFVMYNKACFICGSFDHVQAYCKYHQRKRMVYGNNYNRVIYNYTTNMTQPNAKRNMVPRAVLMKTSLNPFKTTRTVNTAHPKSIVFSAKPMSYFSKSAQSTVRRPYQSKTILNNKRFTQTNNTAKAKVVNTARPKADNTDRLHSADVNAVRFNQANVVKASACWVWIPTKLDSVSITLKKHNYIDARGRSNGCSRHMTGNIAYLSDFKKFDGGYVTFGGGAHGGRISGKGTLKTDSLDFEDVYFVNELNFNLFSVSQMCDKKNYVLFTDTECLVLSPNFKLPDESQILLKIPRKDNMYSFDMKNIVPKESLTCLVAKATSDESMLWHRRLGHIKLK